MPDACRDIALVVPDGIDLGQIHESGQCFRWQPVGEGYLIPCGRRVALARTAGAHTLVLSGIKVGDIPSWRAYFDLDTDYAALRARVDARRDPFLAAAIDSQRGLRILRQDPWEMLVTSIMTQNRSIPIIRASVEKLCAAAGRALGGSETGSFYAFPSPSEVMALSDEVLGGCALGYRARYVRAAARAACEGTIDLNALRTMDDTACREALMRLDGVGPKVAACAMLFGLHRMNAFPVDVWVRRILENEYPGGYPFVRYSPYNGLYQQYMFAFYRKKTKN